jgi:hypothetical protein
MQDLALEFYEPLEHQGWIPKEGTNWKEWTHPKYPDVIAVVRLHDYLDNFFLSYYVRYELNMSFEIDYQYLEIPEELVGRVKICKKLRCP